MPRPSQNVTPSADGRPRVLVVEDEDRQRATLVRKLTRDGFETLEFGSAEAALERLEGEDAPEIHAVLTDLRLPGASGIEMLRRIRAIDEEVPAIVMTAYASVETAIEALRAGAHDYILKPVFFEELTRKLSHALAHRELVRDNLRLRQCLRNALDDRDLVGDSAAMAELRRIIERAAAVDSTVLIVGETGTGKELVAQAIHRAGDRSDEPMLTVNVAALSPTTIEAELFGHERGAFTGADRRRDGILRAAGKGTVFLDEIGEFPLELQPKLLRALEAREVQPVGSDASVSFGARIVAATHRDLRQRVADGEFREDLYYRLDVLRIELPPLRARREDVPGLAQTLLRRICERGGRAAPTLSPTAVRALAAYRWPGNVRELANVLERASVLCDGDRIELEDLPAEIAVGGAEAEDGASDRGAPTDDGPRVLKAAVDAFERRHIARVLRECGGNRDAAAVALGLSPATLYRRLDRLDLKGDKANELD